MSVNYMTGAYRGVPFSMDHSEVVDWDDVNPGNEVAATFLAWGYTGNRGEHANHPKKYLEASYKIIRDLCRARAKTLLAHLKKSSSPEEWQTARDGMDEEDLAYNFISDQLAAAAKDPEALIHLLEVAEIPYKKENFAGYAQGDECTTVFLSNKGKQFTDKELKCYKNFLPKIHNWLYCRCFDVTTPLAKAHAFVDEAWPRLDKSCGATDFVIEKIDALLKPREGNYLVVADFAEGGGHDGTEYVDYDSDDKVRIYVNTMAEAQLISDAFDGNAVITKEKERAL